VKQFWLPQDQIHLYYPRYTNPGEWRVRRNNPATRCHYEQFRGHFMMRVPGLLMPKAGGVHVLVLDGSHRLRDFRPRFILVDAFRPKKRKQYSAIIDALAPFWEV
jgi:hypothetical protein